MSIGDFVLLPEVLLFFGTLLSVYLLYIWYSNADFKEKPYCDICEKPASEAEKAISGGYYLGDEEWVCSDTCFEKAKKRND